MNIQNDLGKLVSDFYSSLSLGNNDKLTDLYVEMVKVRNNLAIEKGFKNYLELQSSFQGVSRTDWKKYLEKRDFIAKEYSPGLSNQIEYPHFLSKINELNIPFPKDVVQLFEDIPEMKDIEARIDLVIEGNSSKFKYNAETDRYIVTIAETNHNQKIAMLIHELSHVADQEKRKHKIPSIFESEECAHKVEFDIAKKISEEFFFADVREYLSCFVRTDLESSIYENPNQSPSKLFSSVFQKYFGKFDEKESHLFLNDEKIIQKPLSDMSVAVAITDLLS